MSSKMTHPRSQLSAHSAPSLYGHAREHDACGIGFVVNIRGQRSQGIVQDGLQAVSYTHLTLPTTPYV